MWLNLYKCSHKTTLTVNLISENKKKKSCGGTKYWKTMIRSGQVQDQEYSLLRKHSHWVIQMQLNSCIKKNKFRLFVLYWDVAD